MYTFLSCETLLYQNNNNWAGKPNTFSLSYAELFLGLKSEQFRRLIILTHSRPMV